MTTKQLELFPFYKLYRWLMFGSIIIAISIISHKANQSTEYYHSTTGGILEHAQLASQLRTQRSIQLFWKATEGISVTVQANDGCIREPETLALTVSITNASSQRIDQTFAEFNLALQKLNSPHNQDSQNKLELPKTLQLDPAATIEYTFNPVPREMYTSFHPTSINLHLVTSEQNQPFRTTEHFFFIHSQSCKTEPHPKSQYIE